MIKKITMFLLVMVLLMPIEVNASKKLFNTEKLDDASGLGFVGRIGPGYDHLGFYDHYSDIAYSYEWNKNRTVLSPDFDYDVLEDDDEGWEYLNEADGVSYNNRTLEMDPNPSMNSLYQYHIIDDDTLEVIFTSDYLYYSPNIGNSVGIISEGENMNVYRLSKGDRGTDYITDSGYILFEASVGEEYTLIYNSDRTSTFMNDTFIIIVYYDESSDSPVIRKASLMAFQELLDPDDSKGITANDLEGIEIETNLVSTAGDKYIEVKLNNYIYFLNPTATEVLYEKEIDDNNDYEFYGATHNNKDYIFLDLYEKSPYGQILTEVFDLEGNMYYDDIEWLNLYFTMYGALFGIEEVDNKYYAIFIDTNGTEIYRKDITGAEVGNFYSNYYGELLAADHNTAEINNGKYLVELFNDNVNDNQYFVDYEILTILDSYRVIEGANQKYTPGNNKNATIKINADRGLFSKLYIDDIEVNTNNYVVTEGSTVITLLSSYLNTLKPKTYELKATFTNDETVITQFVVNKAINNPDTGDEIKNSIFVGFVSLVGLLGTSLYLKKKRCY